MASVRQSVRGLHFAPSFRAAEGARRELNRRSRGASAGSPSARGGGGGGGGAPVLEAGRVCTGHINSVEAGAGRALQALDRLQKEHAHGGSGGGGGGQGGESRRSCDSPGVQPIAPMAPSTPGGRGGPLARRPLSRVTTRARLSSFVGRASPLTLGCDGSRKSSASFGGGWADVRGSGATPGGAVRVSAATPGGRGGGGRMLRASDAGGATTPGGGAGSSATTARKLSVLDGAECFSPSPTARGGPLAKRGLGRNDTRSAEAIVDAADASDPARQAHLQAQQAQQAQQVQAQAQVHGIAPEASPGRRTPRHLSEPVVARADLLLGALDQQASAASEAGDETDVCGSYAGTTSTSTTTEGHAHFGDGLQEARRAKDGSADRSPEQRRRSSNTTSSSVCEALVGTSPAGAGTAAATKEPTSAGAQKGRSFSTTRL